jgi:heme exporter protein CcmD
MSGYFSMGGYAAFVWPCFLLTAIVLAWNVVAARRLHAAARSKVLRKTPAAKGGS